jgi:hypothetical protein
MRFLFAKQSVLNYTMLLLLRPLLVFLCQVVLFLVLSSWEKTFIWWPFQMILANIVCFGVLVLLIKSEKGKLSRIYLNPFPAGGKRGKISGFLERRRYNCKVLNLAYDLFLVLVIFLVFGIPAIILVSVIGGRIQAEVEWIRYATLPVWAVYGITVLLPLTMPLVEIPWYFGYFFPKLESLFCRGERGRTAAHLKAFLLTGMVFSVQHCFMPLIFSWNYIGWRSIMLLPVIIVAGATMRVIPRLTPAVLAIHGIMAVEVVLKYWNFR